MVWYVRICPKKVSTNQIAGFFKSIYLQTKRPSIQVTIRSNQPLKKATMYISNHSEQPTIHRTEATIHGNQLHIQLFFGQTFLEFSICITVRLIKVLHKILMSKMLEKFFGWSYCSNGFKICLIAALEI